MMSEMRKWRQLFETPQVTARLKDGREISLDHLEDFDDGLHCLEVFAKLDGEMVGNGKYDMDRGEFRGIEVEQAFRRLGIASAIYDYVEKLGYDVKPSPYLQPDGIALWTARQKRQQNEALRAEVEHLRHDLEVRYPGVSLWCSIGPAGNLIVSQIVVPKALRNRGIGTAVMQELTTFADQHALPMSLTPDNSYGGSVTRLRVFYRRFGFRPNKDYRFSESMTRWPKV